MEHLSPDYELLQTRRVQAQATGKTVSPSIADEILNSHSEPFNMPNRALFRPRFEFDLSQIKIHTEDKTSETAQAINTQADTSGRNMMSETGITSTTNKIEAKIGAVITGA